jgi:hypothetical protein
MLYIQIDTQIEAKIHEYSSNDQALTAMIYGEVAVVVLLCSTASLNLMVSKANKQNKAQKQNTDHFLAVLLNTRFKHQGRKKKKKKKPLDMEAYSGFLIDFAWVGIEEICRCSVCSSERE